MSETLKLEIDEIIKLMEYEPAISDSDFPSSNGEHGDQVYDQIFQQIQNEISNQLSNEILLQIEEQIDSSLEMERRQLEEETDREIEQMMDFRLNELIGNGSDSESDETDHISDIDQLRELYNPTEQSSFLKVLNSTLCYSLISDQNIEQSVEIKNFLDEYYTHSKE
mmetsp:Transcript_11426/g.17006  ORF Transcript_11426/g.17006 Transcript_11426/m.17006 type:complete len:167 (+) Transcript_11426:10-510(+)